MTVETVSADGSQDIYFLANRSDKAVAVNSKFRVSGMTPELWHPATGERRALPDYEDNQRTISKTQSASYSILC